MKILITIILISLSFSANAAVSEGTNSEDLSFTSNMIKDKRLDAQFYINYQKAYKFKCVSKQKSQYIRKQTLWYFGLFEMQIDAQKAIRDEATRRIQAIAIILNHKDNPKPKLPRVIETKYWEYVLGDIIENYSALSEEQIWEEYQLQGTHYIKAKKKIAELRSEYIEVINECLSN